MYVYIYIFMFRFTLIYLSIYLFPNLGVDLQRLPGVPNPTDYRETFLECSTPETTVRLPGVPNPKDCRETFWSAQPGDARTSTPVSGVPQWIVD